MKISTTTGSYQNHGDSRVFRDMEEVLRTLSRIGYDTLDLSLTALDHPELVLNGEDWERKVDELGESAARWGISFYQSHIPYIEGCSPLRDPAFADPAYEEFFKEMMRRAYVASSRLGVKWTAVHPLTFPQYNYENQASLEGNHRFFDAFVELGDKLGVGTAFENMPSTLSSQYCQHYDQLIELADSYHDPLVGICWDVGHANLCGLQQGRAIRTIGKRLKILHINDNFGDGKDLHLLPYIGRVDWEDVMSALADIGFDGPLNYEAGKTYARAYGQLQEQFAKLAYDNGVYLVKLFEKYRAQKSGGASARG